MTFNRYIVWILIGTILLVSACVPLAPLEPTPTLVPTIAITYVITAPREEARALQPTSTASPTQTLTVPSEFVEVTPEMDTEAEADTEAAVGAATEASPQPDASESDYAPPPADDTTNLDRQPDLTVAEGPTQTPAGVIIVGDVDDPRANQTPEPMPTPEDGETETPTQAPDDGDDGDDGDEGETPGSSSFATFFLFSVGDDGGSGTPAGCGDSLVEVNLPLETPTDNPLRVSLEQLLALEDQYVGDLELYNPLWQSDLQVQTAAIGGGGNAEISMVGELNLADACDNVRIPEMLEQMALNIPGVQLVNITINESPIEEIFPPDTSE